MPQKANNLTNPEPTNPVGFAHWLQGQYGS